MGRSVGRWALPLAGIAALGALGWATGGFGLLGAGAGAAEGGAAALGGAGADLGLAVTGGAGGAMQSAGELAVLSHATAAASAPLTAVPAESVGLWGMLKSNADVIGLGLSGVSILGRMSQTQDQSRFEEALLAHQQTQDAIALETRGLEAERQLSDTLAKQTNLYAARGVDPASGSALANANAAEAAAERRLSTLYAQDSSAIYAIRQAAVRRSRSGLMLGGLADFGSSAFKVVAGRNRIGRA